MTLGERLKEKRKEYKWTQKEIADKLGVDNTTVSKWESNTYEPDATSLKELAEIYQTSTDYLLNKQSKEENHFSSDDREEATGLAFITGGDSLTAEEAEYLKESLELFRRMKEKRAKSR
ncbi:helix-turn-helix domain-containing protein [Brevibacillus laterosporus]|uniref:Helix-turn-helix transcriptional regulator n=1 Tax=Brevibacillus laterosporus TaxID=1465 RepID=A0AAP3GCG4_BRELA|nr:helix-turn-helix transcriptional regulator [Brevibacillus laterosporus]AYB36944.1 XRE family transcriptional regulator [Brevibacillus laterosporus]MBM7107350.1 HTH-type transcriptional regulator ImmR [Brevibacillus laterosporus]MCR8981391.1 helix-turn-helix domain-containing protein [Brevibacillus laterosporus]MCZ0808545.1 helix-turn-helix transcriptional regulator [Brevibacillus laterosporus]MCZ0826902.1 helix-turn-helix transcriptional regulator [Brevibacillus laterosporus]